MHTEETPEFVRYALELAFQGMVPILIRVTLWAQADINLQTTQTSKLLIALSLTHISIFTSYHT